MWRVPVVPSAARNVRCLINPPPTAPLERKTGILRFGTTDGSEAEVVFLLRSLKAVANAAQSFQVAGMAGVSLYFFP